MKNRFRLYRRPKGGVFYAHDSVTGKQESLGTRDRAEAVTLLNARNESIRQPQLNLQIAKAYLAGTDSGVSSRTWQNALDAVIDTKGGSTRDRWRRAAKETALDLIRDRVIIETQAEHLLAAPVRQRHRAAVILPLDIKRLVEIPKRKVACLPRGFYGKFVAIAMFRVHSRV